MTKIENKVMFLLIFIKKFFLPKLQICFLQLYSNLLNINFKKFKKVAKKLKERCIFNKIVYFFPFCLRLP